MQSGASGVCNNSHRARGIFKQVEEKNVFPKKGKFISSKVTFEVLFNSHPEKIDRHLPANFKW